MTVEDGGARGGRVWTRPVFVIGASALAAMVLVGIVVGGQALLAPCGGWFSSLTSTTTGECVGVVHGGELGDDREVNQLIGRFDTANGAVADSGGSYVKIVLLTPLSVADGAPPAIPREQILAGLEGAFTAMDRINGTSAFGSLNAPRIQVVLANQGSRQVYDPALVEGILDESEPDHPVVAVAGLGSSFGGTAETARALSGKGIPMVSAVASATDLNAVSVPGQRSVSPSNTEYVRALRDFLDTQGLLRSAAIVADQNNDSYTRTLREAFAGELRRYVRVSDPLTFNGSTVETQATPGVFSPVVANLCNVAADPQVQVDTVLYAGRVTDFRSFVDALSTRACKTRPLAILVGATGFDAARDYENIIQDANLTVVYATSADAASWTQNRPGTPVGFPDFLSRYRANGFAEESLGDGYAIMYHDAVASTAVGVRLAALGNPVPGPASVDTQLNNVARAYSARGASGTLSFTTDGRAAGKVVPLRQIGRTTPVVLPERRCTYVVGGPCAPS